MVTPRRRRIRRRWAVLALIASAACGSSSSPTSPATPPTPAVAVNPLTQSGTWTVYLTVDSCVDTRFQCPTSAGLVEMTLRTATLGGALTAIVRSETVWFTSYSVVVAGQAQADGSVRYTGTYQASPSSVYRSLEVAELVLRPDATAGLTGTLQMIQTTESGVRTVKATVRSASRQPFADTTRVFQGAFDGFGTLLACEGSCPNRTAGARITIALRLWQIGGNVNGTFGLIGTSGGVEGSVTENTLTLAGEWRAPLDQSGLGTTFSRVESLSGSLDALGRLIGTVRLYNEGMYDSRSGAITVATPFTERLTIELTSVVRQ